MTVAVNTSLSVYQLDNDCVLVFLSIEQWRLVWLRPCLLTCWTMTAAVNASLSVYQLDNDCVLVCLPVKQATVGVIASLYVNLLDNDGWCNCVLVCLSVGQWLRPCLSTCWTVTIGVIASLFVNLLDNDCCCKSVLVCYLLDNDCVLVCQPVEQWRLVYCVLVC